MRADMDNERRCRTLEELLRKYELRGEQRGEQRGKQQGKYEHAVDMAIMMIADGVFAVETIARYSGLTVEEIMKLKEQYEG